MKFGVVIFPGSNCDQDLIQVLESVSGTQVESLWHKDTDLKGCDFIFLPGGFSYGDYLRSGAIAKLSPVMGPVKAFSERGGLVMGICNGFQILCEAEMLPGALLRNSGQKFLCTNLYIKAEHSNSVITSQYTPGQALKIPIAHAEGRYYADEATLSKLESNGQVLFRYCTEDGTVSQEANPNGSLNHIAGICNEGRNVFGMMPHPERAASERLFNTDGLPLFEGILEQAASKL